MSSMIYVIKNTVNDSVYVGQTSQSLEERMQHHNSNCKSGQTTFYKSMREIGKENFYIEPLEIVDDNEANQKELFWIKKFKETNPMYNMKFTEGKCGGDTLTDNPNLEKIKKTISDKTSFGRNHRAREVASYDLETHERIEFCSVSACQDYHKIPRHDIITRRCSGKINIPYGNLMFDYLY